MEANGKRNQAAGKPVVSQNNNVTAVNGSGRAPKSRIPNKSTKQPIIEQPREKTGKNIIVVDTNVLIDDRNAIQALCDGGNLLVIPATVSDELDNLKYDHRVGFEAREATRQIDYFQEIGYEYLIEESGMNFGKLHLKKDKPDHQIVATVNYVLYQFSRGHEPYCGYDKVKLVTSDRGVKIAARRILDKKNLVIEMYRKTQIKIEKKDLEIPLIYIPKEKVSGDWAKKVTFPANGLAKSIPDGSAIIGYSSKKNAKKGEFAAVRQGNVFEIINSNIESCGIKPKSKKNYDRHNWEQAIALYYVLEPSFDCVFLQGPAGSGKTLIAIAAALEQQRKGLYSKVLVFRVPEPVDRKKTLGLLPGSAGEKIGLYTRPISKTLTKLLKNNKSLIRTEKEEISNVATKPKKKNSKEKEKEIIQNSNGRNHSNLEVHVDDIFEQNGFEIAVLEYIRGETLDEVYIIVDDAQNLSQHEVKTMITRVGERAKIIFTGDLAQIDSPYLDGNSSGLAHAIKKMGGDPQVGAVTLVQTLRSRIASLGESVL